MKITVIQKHEIRKRKRSWMQSHKECFKEGESGLRMQSKIKSNWIPDISYKWTKQEQDAD